MEPVGRASSDLQRSNPASDPGAPTASGSTPERSNPSRTSVLLNESGPVLRPSPFGSHSQQADGAPWQPISQSPEHALLKILPSYVSHLKPALAAAVTKELLQDATAVVRDIPGLPSRVSATILKLLISPSQDEGAASSEGGHSSTLPPALQRGQAQSGARSLRPAMSTGSISSAPGSLTDESRQTLAHAASLQQSPASSLRPSLGGSASSSERPSPRSSRTSSQLSPHSSGQTSRHPGLPPLPPSSPTLRPRLSGEQRTTAPAPPAPTPATTPRRLQLPPPQARDPHSTTPTSIHSDPVAGTPLQLAGQSKPSSAPAAGRQLVSAVTVTVRTSMHSNQPLVLGSAPVSPSHSDTSQLMAFESSSALATDTSMETSDIAHSVGQVASPGSRDPLPQPHPHHPSSVLGLLHTTVHLDSSGTCASTAGSDRTSLMSAGDRLSLASDQMSIPSGSDRPSTAMSDRSSLLLGDRGSAVSDRGISARPSWETGSVSSRTSTVHGSASSVPIGRGRGAKSLSELAGPILTMQGSKGVDVSSPQQRGGELPLTPAAAAASGKAWQQRLAASQQMQATLQHLQILQTQPLVSALSMRPGKGFAGPGHERISEGGDGDDQEGDPAAMGGWPSAFSSSVSSPAAGRSSDKPGRTLVDVGVQVGPPALVDSPPRAPQGALLALLPGSPGQDELGREGSIILASAGSAGSLEAPGAYGEAIVGASVIPEAEEEGMGSEGATSEDSSNPDEDVNKAVQQLLRRYYPRVAASMQTVLETVCSDAELLKLAAAARSAQPMALEEMISTSLGRLLTEHDAAKKRVRELESRGPRISLMPGLVSGGTGPGSTSASFSGPSSGPSISSSPPASVRSWKDAKARLLRETLASAARDAAVRESSSGVSTSSVSTSSGSIPLSLLLGARLEGGGPAIDVGSARSSEAGTELTFAQNSSPATSSSDGRGSLTGTARTSSDGACQEPRSVADSVDTAGPPSGDQATPTAASALAVRGGPETLCGDTDEASHAIAPDPSPAAAAGAAGASGAVAQPAPAAATDISPAAAAAQSAVAALGPQQPLAGAPQGTVVAVTQVASEAALAGSSPVQSPPVATSAGASAPEQVPTAAATPTDLPSTAAAQGIPAAVQQQRVLQGIQARAAAHPRQSPAARTGLACFGRCFAASEPRENA